MKKPDGRKGKHITPGQRVRIESGLNSNLSLRQIARDIGKDVSSVSREIMRHTQTLPATANDCAFREDCRVLGLCGKQYCKSFCRRKCASRCMQLCKDYRPAKCEALLSSPHTCNGCRGYKACTLERRIYRAQAAEKMYRRNLVDTRSGFDLTDEELAALDDLVSPLILMGQSPYHIMQSHPEEIPVSLPTLYKLLESGLLTARSIDLKQQVCRKPRKKKRKGTLHNEVGALSACKAGHLWEDFLTYMEENDTFYVQMDCVEGKQEEPQAVLTLHYPDFRMQLAFYLKKQDSAHVVKALNSIEKALGTELFMETFPVILTDNGSEFTDIEGMESSCLTPGAKRTHVFFCEPNRSDEKGACENNHKLIRDVIPKGTSLRDYTQADITLMMNHINSYRRKKAMGKSAYDICMGIFPKEFFKKLGLRRIPDDEVLLKPALLRSRVYERTLKMDHRPKDRKKNI